VRIGTKKGPNGEQITLTEPDEVRQLIHDEWKAYFSPKIPLEGAPPSEWKKSNKRIIGEKSTNKIKSQELTEAIASSANGKAPGPTRDNWNAQMVG